MIINCKACEKKFVVPDQAIPAKGRLVQCSSCGNKWEQFPLINKTSKISLDQKIKENKITNIYVLKPLHGDNNPLENIFGHCLEKKIFSTTFYKIDLRRCNI